MAVILLRDIWRWLPRFWRWLRQTRPIVLPLGLALVAVVTAVLLPPSLLQWPRDDRVRYCGIAFELVGIYIVVVGLHGRQQLFDRPTFVAQIVAWARRFPRLRPRAITMSAQGLGGAGVRASGRLSVWRAFRADASVEQRLETLETNLTRLKSEFEEQITTTEQRQRELGRCQPRNDRGVLGRRRVVVRECAGRSGLGHSADDEASVSIRHTKRGTG